jgi:hypothetical protein
MGSNSLWYQAAKKENFPRLDDKIKADVCSHIRIIPKLTTVRWSGIKMNLRRGETRTDVEFEVDVNKMVLKDNYPVVLPEIYQMRVINLSVNGIMLFSKAEFSVGEYSTRLSFICSSSLSGSSGRQL